MGRRWAWCALDAVGIVGAVGEGNIRSETADGRVELHVQHGELEPSEVASFVPDGSGMTSSVDQWCPLVNFFPTFEAATARAEQSGLPGRPVALTTIAARLVDRCGIASTTGRRSTGAESTGLPPPTVEATTKSRRF
jgi:hypothetical protein